MNLKAEKILSARNILIALTLFSYLIAWNRGINLLYGMFSLLSATLLVSHLVPKFALRYVSAKRELPGTAFEDDEIDIAIELKNIGYSGRHMIEVVDSIPAAAPGFEKPMTFAARLRGLGSRSYSYRLGCYKRGEYTVGPIILRTSYPLGLISSEKTMEDSQKRLLVYPKTFQVASFPLMSGSAVPASGSEAMSKVGGSDEFFGVREYRSGDSLRYIHWRSSARLGKLIVKEFEVRGSTEVSVFIDLERGSERGEGKETTLEYSVKTAASIAKYVLERGHSLQFLAQGGWSWVIPSARGISQFPRVLEALARVRANGNMSFPRMVSFFSGLLRDGGTAVLIFSGGHAEFGAFLDTFAILRARRVRPVCVLLNEKSFDHSGGSTLFDNREMTDFLTGNGIPYYIVSKGDDMEAMFSE